MSQKKVAVLIEDHFDQTEFRRFNQFFPEHGYDVEYVSHLWKQPSLTFGSNPDNGTVEEHVEVTREILEMSLEGYRGLLLIGAYAMDRLRYQPTVQAGQPNSAPAVMLLRQALQQPKLKIGTICHSLWLFCADRRLIEGRRVTCAHNIICDVENAGGVVVYDGNQTSELVVDGNLISGKHPGMVDKFLDRFLEEMEAAWK